MNCQTCGAADAVPVTVSGERAVLCQGCTRYWRDLRSYHDALQRTALTAQLASGAPAKPAKLKPAETLDLFDSPEAITGRIF